MVDLDDWMKIDDNPLLYFQEWLDEETIVHGYINKETKKGRAHIYKWHDADWVDLNTTEIKENPESLEEKIARFAYDALERITK